MRKVLTKISTPWKLNVILVKLKLSVYNHLALVTYQFTSIGFYICSNLAFNKHISHSSSLFIQIQIKLFLDVCTKRVMWV